MTELDDALKAQFGAYLDAAHAEGVKMYKPLFEEQRDLAFRQAGQLLACETVFRLLASATPPEARRTAAVQLDIILEEAPGFTELGPESAEGFRAQIETLRAQLTAGLR